MEETGPMPLEHWLGDLADTSQAAPPQIAALAALGDMLDALKPQYLDRERSSVRWCSLGPEDPSPMVLVTLEHVTDRDATVEVAIWPDQANIGWLDEDEQMSEDYAGADEEWTSAVADLVASVLRGDYAVEDTYWLGRWIRTRIMEIRPGSKPRQRSISVNWPWWLLIRPPGADVSLRRLDFGVRSD